MLCRNAAAGDRGVSLLSSQPSQPVAAPPPDPAELSRAIAAGHAALAGRDNYDPVKWQQPTWVVTDEQAFRLDTMRSTMRRRSFVHRQEARASTNAGVAPWPAGEKRSSRCIDAVCGSTAVFSLCTPADCSAKQQRQSIRRARACLLCACAAVRCRHVQPPLEGFDRLLPAASAATSATSAVIRSRGTTMMRSCPPPPPPQSGAQPPLGSSLPSVFSQEEPPLQLPFQQQQQQQQPLPSVLHPGLSTNNLLTPRCFRPSQPHCRRRSLLPQLLHSTQTQPQLQPPALPSSGQTRMRRRLSGQGDDIDTGESLSGRNGRGKRKQLAAFGSAVSSSDESHSG